MNFLLFKNEFFNVYIYFLKGCDECTNVLTQMSKGTWYRIKRFFC